MPDIALPPGPPAPGEVQALVEAARRTLRHSRFAFSSSQENPDGVNIVTVVDSEVEIIPSQQPFRLWAQGVFDVDAAFTASSTLIDDGDSRELWQEIEWGADQIWERRSQEGPTLDEWAELPGQGASFPAPAWPVMRLLGAVGAERLECGGGGETGWRVEADLATMLGRLPRALADSLASLLAAQEGDPASPEGGDGDEGKMSPLVWDGPEVQAFTVALDARGMIRVVEHVLEETFESTASHHHLSLRPLDAPLASVLPSYPPSVRPLTGDEVPAVAEKAAGMVKAAGFGPLG